VQEARVTLRFKYLGLGMLLVGLVGFWLFQL
jgi:preprotein translocase subunit Sss1